MAECAHCGESIESGKSYGFRVRPIGNSEQLKGVLVLMGGGMDADRLIAAGWNTCIRCMAILTLDSLRPTQRDEVLHRFGH
jgi:hypothetical protein